MTEEASETLTLLEAKDSDTLTLLKAKERLADAGAGAPPPPPTPPASIVPQAIPRPQPTARVKPASPTSSVAPPSQCVSSMTSKTEDSSAAAAAMFKRFGTESRCADAPCCTQACKAEEDAPDGPGNP